MTAVVEIARPDSWIPLDFDQLRDSASMDRLLAARAASDPEIAAHRADLKELLARTAAEAIRVGVGFAAVTVHTPDGNPIASTMTVLVTDLDTSAAEPPDRDWCGAIIGSFRDEGHDTHRTDRVAIPAGQAVRTVSVQHCRLDELNGEMVVLVVQYFVPYPEENTLAVVTFTTTGVQFASRFIPLFDTMASTVSFLTEGDALSE